MGTLTKVFQVPEEIHPLQRVFGELPPSLVQDVFNGMDLTPRTRNQYIKKISRFVDWVQEGGWSSDVLIRFKTYLRDDVNLTTSSKNIHLTVSRIFCNRLNQLRVFPFEFDTPKNFKTSQGHKRPPITKSDIGKIFDFVDSDLFLKTLFTVLYFQGLRSEETRNIRIENIQLDNGRMMISGKGRDGDMEEILLHPRSIEVLSEYIKDIQKSSGPLFNGRFPNRPIGPTKFWTSITDVFKELGIQNSPHGLRKSFVSSLVENPDLDLITISKFSRHKSINTLSVYFDRVSIERSFPTVVNSLNISCDSITEV